QARQAVAIRTFDVGHIFWIPILPVGYWKHWQCTTCGREPHTSPRTRRSFKWTGLFILILVSVLFWVAPATQEDAPVTWAIRIGATVGAVLLLTHLLRTPKDISLREMLATIPPATDALCPFCCTPLLGGTKWSCPGCGVVRY
ncbi:MAG: hypothetical protein WB562_19920, partial [Candidatus Sulfotelmatobacter sp.]